MIAACRADFGAAVATEKAESQARMDDAMAAMDGAIADAAAANAADDASFSG